MHVSRSLTRHCSSTQLRDTAHGLHFKLFRKAPSVIAVDVDGDIDASNARELVRYVTRVREPRDDVVLDLSGVTFFGTHGFTALMELIMGRSEPVVVPSRVVERVLQLCDEEARVHVASDPDAAMAMLRGNTGD